MRRASILLLLLSACSGGRDGDDVVVNRDGGTTTSRSCGIEGAPSGTDCDGFDQCGGAANVGRRGNCEHCPNEALMQTCSSGTCVEYDRTGNIDVGFNVFDVGEGGNSYIAMVIDPLHADGTEITCQALLSTCSLADTHAVNVVNVDLGEPVGGLQRDRAYTRLLSAHVGSNRLAYVIVAEQSDGNGRILAHGCGVAAEVTSGQTTQVPIMLVAP